ncbi:MAG: MATE family efflux transporter [Parvibaculaceae bacterium]
MTETMPKASGEGAPATREARFVTGSTKRHVLVMTLTGAVGLMAVFLVDLLNLFFLSQLGDIAITAAIGYAGALSFINLSFSLGTGVAAAALIARNMGAGNVEAARRFATNSLVFAFATSSLLSGGMALFAEPLLKLLGAHGEALALAKLYFWTVSVSFPLLAASIACSFSLRGIGDPVRAMHVTLSAAVVDGCLAPLFIFGFGLSIQGAALSIIFAEVASLVFGLLGIVRHHRFLVPFTWVGFRDDLKPILNIASAAVMTQLATPFAVAWMTRVIAHYGDEAVAAATIVNRLIPVAFGIVFSLSGAVGPIIGQNFGAGRMERVKQSLTDAFLFAGAYTLLTSAVLFALRHVIPDLFRVEGEAAALVTFYCTWLAVTWCFSGAQFVAQAAFNNLGRPHWSTIAGWGRATIGTIPFIHVGGLLAGAEGVLVGSAAGSVLFGFLAAATAYWLVHSLARSPHPGA